ncbi:MAG: hypothetical protein MJ252_29285 [archaeon]|nr:hypothetical protein [archaeon]
MDLNQQILDGKYILTEPYENKPKIYCSYEAKNMNTNEKVKVFLLTSVDTQDIDQRNNFFTFFKNYNDKLSKIQNIIIPIDYKIGKTIKDNQFVNDYAYVVQPIYDPLENYLVKQGTFDEKLSKIIISQILQALVNISDFLGLPYVPISNQNIYFDYEHGYKVKVGNICYLYAQFNKGKEDAGYNPKNKSQDASSIASISYNLLTGKELNNNRINKIKRNPKKFLEALTKYNISEEYFNFFISCFENMDFKKFSDSPNIYERILSTPWLSKIGTDINVFGDYEEELIIRKQNSDESKERIIQYNKEIAFNKEEDKSNSIVYRDGDNPRNIFVEGIIIQSCEINESKARYYFILNDLLNPFKFMNDLSSFCLDILSPNKLSSDKYNFQIIPKNGFMEFRLISAEEEECNSGSSKEEEKNEEISFDDNDTKDIHFYSDLEIVFKLYVDNENNYKYLLNIYHLSGNIFAFNHIYRSILSNIKDFG